MKRIIKNSVRAAFVCVGAYCSARIFFLLGFECAKRGIGFLIGTSYMIGTLAAIWCMYGLYSDAHDFLSARKEKRERGE